MFEGWASDLLAAYLGQILEVQREQLRISLWRAWSTGLTLENVALRADAFDHLQLPFKLHRGSVGRMTAQVPWRAHRSPVVLELADVEICLRLLGPADLAPHAASARSAVAKQVLIAAEELQDLAGGIESEGPKQGGMLMSLVRHAVSMLLRRLRLTVQNIHIRVEDPCSGRAFGLRLGQLRTCQLDELGASARWLSEDYEGDNEGGSTSPLGNGGIQKQFSAMGIQAYWIPGNGSEDEIYASTSQEGEDGGVGSQWDILKPTAVDISLSTELSGAGSLGARVRLGVLPLQVRSSQALDMTQCADTLQWLTVRARYAHLRPEPSGGIASGFAVKDMWRYAVNAVLQDIRGPRKAARWQPPEAVQHARRRYVLLYRKKLELEKELQANPKQRRTSEIEDTGTALQEGPSQASDSAAVSTPQATAAPTPVLSPIGEQQLLDLEQELSVADIITCRTAARHAVVGTSRPQSAASEGDGDSNSGVSRRGVSWGVAKAASFMGYVPRPFSSGTELPQPSESEVKELYEAIEFNPEEEEEREQEAGGAGHAERTEETIKGGSSGVGTEGLEGVSAIAGHGAEFSVKCLVESIHLELLCPVGETQAAVTLDGLTIKAENSGGPDGTTVTARLVGALAQDWVSHGPGVSAPLMLRKSTSSLQPALGNDEGGGEAPLLSMKFAVQRRMLDVMVQPLQVYAAPACLRALSSFLPPLDPETYAATCMRAVNALSLEARASIKARRLRHLGRSLNVVLKVVDVEVVLASEAATPGIGQDPKHAALLRTGEIIVHNIGLAELSDDAARVFSVLDRLLGATKESYAGARNELTAAASVVEERLVYQSLELSIAGIQLLCPSTASDQTGHATALHPVKVAGSFRIHRIPEDYGVPQVLCSLQIDPIVAALSPALLEQISAGLNLKGDSEGEEVVREREPAPIVAGHPPTPERPPWRGLGPAHAIIDVRLAGADVSYTVVPPLPVTPRESAFSLPPPLALQVRASLRTSTLSLTAYASGVATKVNIGGLLLRDLTYDGGVLPGVKGGVLPRLASRLAIEGAHVSTSPAALPGDAHIVEVQLIDIIASGFDEEPGNFIARVHEQQPTHINVTVATSPSTTRTSVAVSNVATGHATILRIAALFGLGSSSESTAEEGTTSDGGRALRSTEPTTVQSSNGYHNETSPSPEHASETQHSGPNLSIELHDCRILWKFHQAASAGCHMPAALHDFLLLHEDIASLEIPHFYIQLPLLLEPSTSLGAHPSEASMQTAVSGAPSSSGDSTPPGSGSHTPTSSNSAGRGPSPSPGSKIIFARGLCLNVATVGFPGRPVLPLLQVPLVTLGPSSDSGIMSRRENDIDLQKLQLSVPSLDLGVHPSHFTTAAAAWQLLQQELALVARDPADVVTDGESIVTSNSTANQDLTPTLARTITTAPRTGEGVSDTAAVSSLHETTRNQAPFERPWQVEVSLGALGISVVGSMPSSTCLKVEWHRVTARISGTNSTSTGRPSLAALLSWHALSLYELQPKAGDDFIMDNTPFPSGLLHSADGYASPVAPSTTNSLLRGGQGTRTVRRSLSTGLGLAGAAAAAATDSPQGGFQAPPASYMMARFSASSAVSRYFSAADSEFEDATSEALDGSKSPPGGVRSPRPPLLPLDISSVEYDASLLARISSNTDEGAGGAGLQQRFNMTATQCGHRIELGVEALTVRVYLHGWESAVECANIYQAFASRAHRHMLAAREPSEKTAQQPKSDALQTAVSRPSAHITLRLAGIALEAIAAPGSASEVSHNENWQRRVPVGSVDVHMEASFHSGSDGGRGSVRIPGTLLSIGSVPAGSATGALALTSRDALIGISGIELSASTRVVQSAQHVESGTATAAAGIEPSNKVIRLDAKVKQVSLWASQHNLSSAAALVQHFSHLAAHTRQLQSMHHGHHSKSPVPATKPAAATTSIELAVGVNTLTALLHTIQPGHGGSLSPLFELAVTDLVVAAARLGNSAALVGDVSLQIELDVFNLRKLAWESCIDPWPVEFKFALPLGSSTNTGERAFDGQRPAASEHTRLDVHSLSGLEATVTSTVADAAASVAAMMRHVSSVSLEPDTLHRDTDSANDQAAAAADVAGSLSTAYQLRNLTGATLEVWLVEPLAGGGAPVRPPIGPPDKATVPSSATAALPVLELQNSESSGRKSGRPSSSLGVVHEFISSEELDASQNNQRRRRTLMYFRIAGEGPLAGPVYLDRPEAALHSVQIGQPSDPYVSTAVVVSETVEVGPGAFVSTLHSGLCLKNTTGIALEIGLQTPLGAALGEPHALGMLQAGETTWLPILRPDTAELCARPSQSYRPHTLPRLPLTLPPKGGGSTSGPRLPTSTLGTSGVVYRSTTHLASPHRRSAADLHGPSLNRFEWSPSIKLGQLFPPSQQAPRESSPPGPFPRHVSCAPTAEDNGLPLILSVGALPIGAPGTALEITLGPPLVVHNALPVPMDITLRPKWSPPLVLHLGPTEQAAMLHLEASAIESVTMRPEGYQHTPQLALAALGALPGEEAIQSFWKSSASTSNAKDVAAAAAAAASQHQHQQPGGQREVWAAPNVKATLHELGPGRSSVDVVLRHGIDEGSGTHMLRVACPLWVYNCTGVPIALRSPLDSAETLGLGIGLPDDSIAAIEDEVPESWVPPLLLPSHGGEDGGAHTGAQSPSLTATPRAGGLAAREPSIGAVVPALPGIGSGLRGVVAGQRGWPLGRHQSDALASARSAPAAGPLSARSTVPLSTARSSVAGSVLSMGRSASVADAPGLSEILDTRRQDGRASPSPSPGGGRSVLGMQRAASRARGIADSMDTAPTFERPSLWPSMSSSLVAAGATTAGHHIRLQLRAAAAKAPPGRSYWTQELNLDASGGAAVASLPSPPPAVGAAAASAGLSSARHRGAYPVVVTAIPVPGADDALALCVAPRYVLRNLLDSPIQYKQQGAGGERELAPGGVRAVRWSDIGLPPRLSVRVQEAGWMWSGGFALDVPGDLFVKIRHRDRGVTMLVRVDVATTDAGIVQITLSHNPSGFAPYRVENCSLETLNARQRGVHEQQDVLRPYCSLNYAWDEPALPHALVLELPGARHIGTFQLDEVGQDVLLHVRTRRGDPERCLRVIIRAEGPTRVLTVMDPLRHTLTAPPLPFPGQPAASTATPSTLVAPVPAPLPNALNPATDSSAGLLWEVSLDLASVGISLVGPEHEVAYFRLTGSAARVAVSAARTALSIQVRGVQLDNPTPWVAYPVALRLPAPFSKLRSSVAAAVELHPAPALAARLSVWHRRPAGVLCVEVAEAEVRSVAIYVDQEHAEEMAAVVARVMARAHLASGQRSSPLLGSNGNGVGGPPESVLGNGTTAAGQDGGGGLIGDLEGDVTPSPAASLAASGQFDVGVGGVRAASPFFNGRLPDLPQLRDLLALGESATDGTHSISHAHGTDAPPGPPIGHQKIYLDLLSLSPVEVTLSFMSSPVHHPAISHPRLAALQRLLALADVEDARLWLAGLRLANPLMDAPALAQALQRHYVKALIPELFKIVGAASVFGDPVSLLHHLGLGVWAFVSAPAAGLVESARQRGPRQFILGVLSGTRGLFSNVIYAVSNAATKASGAARKAIVVWGLDRQDEPLGAGSFRRRVMWAEGDQGGDGTDGGLLAAVLRGAVGVVTEPIRGAEEGGLPGLARGLQRGALGAVALPLASLLEMCARTADSVRRAVAGSSNVGWLRPPRHVSTSEPLAPYDWSQAMGLWLLRELDRAEALRAQRRRGPAPDAREEFSLCSPAGQPECYLVLTSRRVVYVRARGLMWEPVVLWQTQISDLENVASMEGEGLATVRFVAHPPPRPLWLGRRWGGGDGGSGVSKTGLSTSFFSFLSVECADAEAAARVRQAAERSMALTPRRVQSAGFGLVVC